ncbi:MAG: hypothetical protein KAS69_00845 [Planctomycetes bacterium]|nr:hypothetical protein [Planctomycetota bacterium]
MKLPELKDSQKYVGLYIFDFGENCGVGFTAEEVAELLESEKYKDGKVYKIYNAFPDGRLELKGVPSEIFQLEAGMFFYSDKIETANRDFKSLINMAVRFAPPCRVKVNLAKYANDKFVVAMIYPAECDSEISKWLLDGKYKTTGSAAGGIEAVSEYYNSNNEILEKHQLFGESQWTNRSGQELLANLKQAVQR